MPGLLSSDQLFFYPSCLNLLDAKNVVVFPTRTVAIENVLRLFTPRLAIVDDQLTRQLPKQWLTSLALEVPPPPLPFYYASVIPFFDNRLWTSLLSSLVKSVVILTYKSCGLFY
jgi:hypothetical protein